MRKSLLLLDHAGSAACRKPPRATDAFNGVFNNSTMIPFITIWLPVTACVFGCCIERFP
ncbi:hypothetical protein JVT61DRAFT_11784 [Boletus reticuloceps]|uniref:Uncharacterized protein n=1 Tax=Boletus reticuloceps TaxID=495285 RepID=A0A8I3AED3_9AGAM|nr:hypothetical protein JVT61DRAFT_11784 [Boletus reticuloceps]